MTSPFARDRFELEVNRHTFYLPSWLFPKLEQPKAAVVFGSRGTGKTTLLRALHWSERLSNPSLRLQLGTEPFRGRFVGVYTKLPLHQAASFDSWLRSVAQPLGGQIFSFYIELIAVEILTEAISTMLGDQVLRDPTGTAERQVAIKFAASWSSILAWAGCNDCRTILDMYSATMRIREHLEGAAQSNLALGAFANTFVVPGFGALMRSVGSLLGDVCNRCDLVIGGKTVPSSDRWHFKICMDEAEILSRDQQLVINTLIRLTEAPVFLVMSYVGRPHDLTHTLLPRLTSQKADQHLIPLDEVNRQQFRELAEGVATVRLRHTLGDHTVSFNAETTLGRLSLNRLVGIVVQDSEQPKAVELRNLATHFQATWQTKTSPHDDALPYIEAYLAHHRGLTAPDPAVHKASRRQSSSEFRKKMVVAYLAICRDLSRKVIPFASADVVLGTSDGCVRDFLSQLDRIFSAAYPNDNENSLRNFLHNEVDWRVQSRALRKASEDKRDSIPRSGVLYDEKVGRIVKCLAEVTALLQSHVPKHDSGSSAAGFSEKGIFQLAGGTADQRISADTLIRDAAEAGFVHLVFDDSHAGPVKGFRIHCSLAPAFGFSYRGAYYPVQLKISAFEKLLNATSDPELARQATVLAKQELHDDPVEPDLFSHDISDGGQE